MNEIERLAANVRERDAVVRAAKKREDEAHEAWKRARAERVEAEEARSVAEDELVRVARGEKEREIDAAFNKHF